MEIEVKLSEPYIELFKLLKLKRVAENGGQAKMMIEDECAYLNGELELRKRAKIRPGDVVEIFDYVIRVI